MRITVKDLENLVVSVGELSGMATSAEEAEQKGKTRYLRLRKSNGTYLLGINNVENGGYSNFDTALFISAKEMYHYLSGVIKGLDLAQQLYKK